MRKMLIVCSKWLLVVLLFACQTKHKTAFKVEFDQDVTVVLPDESKIPAKRHEIVELPNEALTIVRPNHRPLLLIPVPDTPATLKLRLAKEELAGAGAMQDVNMLLQSIIEIQSLLAEARPDEALIKLSIIQKARPDLSYLVFLEASCYVMKRDFEKAKGLTQRALKEFPNDQAGQALLGQLNSLERQAAPSASEVKQ